MQAIKGFIITHVNLDSKAPGCRRETHHVLIEEINDHVGQPSVAPVSVDQEEFFQVFEARYGEITGHDRLQMTKRSCDKSEAVGQEKKAQICS